MRLRPNKSKKAQRLHLLAGRNTTRAQLRKAFTHVGIIADDPIVQKVLPQIVIAAERLVRSHEALDADTFYRGRRFCGGGILGGLPSTNFMRSFVS